MPKHPLLVMTALGLGTILVGSGWLLRTQEDDSDRLLDALHRLRADLREVRELQRYNHDRLDRRAPDYSRDGPATAVPLPGSNEPAESDATRTAQAAGTGDEHTPSSGSRAGVLLTRAELSDAERAALDLYNRGAQGVGVEIGDAAVYIRGLAGDLCAITAYDSASGLDGLGSADDPALMELAALTARAGVVQGLVLERLVADAEVHATEEIAKEHAETVMRLAKGRAIIRARGGYVVVRTRDVVQAPELAAVKKQLAALRERHGLTADARWLNPGG